MWIHATREEVEALPEPARNFLKAAWAAPNEDGQRTALERFEGSERICHAMAIYVRNAMREPGTADSYFTFSDVEKPHFGQAIFWKVRSAEIAYNLATAWNSRVTLADCAVCGNLMQPGKGRIARTCSPQCRLELHRKGPAA